MMKIAIPVLLLLGATLAAQDPTAVSGVDVHVITVQLPDSVEVPELRAESVLRYGLDPNARNSSPREPDARWGGSPGIERLGIARDSRDRLVLDHKFRHRRMSWSSSGHTVDIAGDVMEFSGAYYGRRASRFGRVYRCLLFIPWSTTPDELEPWAPEAYANWLVQHLLDRGGVGCAAASAMLHIPLVRLVDAPLLARFREWLVELTESGRHPERSNRDRNSTSRMSLRSLILGLRLVAGDPDAVEEMRSHEYAWDLQPPLHLAFIQLGDPVLKGEAGWTLMYPNRRGNGESERNPVNAWRRLIVPYFELAEAGELVIPGTPEEQKRRHAQLAAWVAEADPTAALLVIALAALSLFGVAFAARRVALKLAM